MVVIGSSGVLGPGRLRWLRALGWMIALTVACLVAYNVGAAAIGWLAGAMPGSTGGAPGAKLAAAIAGSVTILLLYGLAVRSAERRAVPELAMRTLPADLLIGLATGAGLIAAIIGLLWLAGWAVIEARPVSEIALALRDSIRSGVVEELVLRLIIFRLLWRALGIWPAMALAAALFGALHLANPDSSLFAGLALLVGEGVGIGLYLLTGRIWASIGMHAAWNFTQGWVFGAAVSGTTGIAGGPLAWRPAAGVPEYLSGGGFGPEASLAALIVSLMASAAFLYRAWTLGRFIAVDDQRSGAQTRGKSATAS